MLEFEFENLSLFLELTLDVNETLVVALTCLILFDVQR